MIKSAAFKLKDGTIFTLPPPNRHPDLYLKAESEGIDLEGRIPGFVTSEGNFVDRKEGYKIAKANNQILPRTDDLAQLGVMEFLHTEDLW